jgi:N-acetylglucosaminyldiphosphoundecaprenol N-acetyl-beta-D-mannosaminyltransferase
MHHKVDILGTEVSSIRSADLFAAFKSGIQQKQFIQVAITPVNSILAAYKNKAVQEVYNASDFVLCDGMPVKWASHFLGTPIVERITGLDLLPDLAAFAAKENFSLFLLGASPGVGEKLKEVILQLYPNCNIAGIYVPPFMPVFDATENQKMVDAVNAAKPDLVLVSLTAPKQDIWIANNKAVLCPAVYIGIGGAFEVMAGIAKRAPKWMHGAGLEWFYRLIQEPKRMYRRYLIEAPLFIPLVLRQKIRTIFKSH